MKNTILFFALFISFAAFAQFPKLKPELLIGHEVRIRPLFDYEQESSQGYHDFFSDADTRNIYMPNKAKKYVTSVDALENHIFMVVNVEPYKLGTSTRYKFTLTENGVTIYYKYDNFRTYLQPVNFTLPEDYYCDYITKDEQDGDVTYSTPTTNHFKLYKFITKSRGIQYNLSVYVQIKGIGPSSGTVILSLENGQKLSYPKSRFSYHAGSAYTSMIALNDADIKVLTENKIKEVYFDSWTDDFTLYSDDLKGILTCLITKK